VHLVEREAAAVVRKRLVNCVGRQALVDTAGAKRHPARLVSSIRLYFLYLSAEVGGDASGVAHSGDSQQHRRSVWALASRDACNGSVGPWSSPVAALLGAPRRRNSAHLRGSWPSIIRASTSRRNHYGRVACSVLSSAPVLDRNPFVTARTAS